MYMIYGILSKQNKIPIAASSKTYMLCVCSLLIASCASVPTTPAPWAASPAALRTLFPDSGYIAAQGRGRTRGAAEANAATEIARFMTSEINATQGYELISGTAVNEAFVKTQIKLFGIRYAEGSFYDKESREWRAAAYIERDEAWRIYEPRFKKQSVAFQALFDAAELEVDTFKKVLRLQAAQRYASTEEFESENLLGQILHSAKMNKEFAAVRAEIAALPQKIDDAKRRAAVYIDCPDDFESLVTNAFSSEFSDLGFPVAKTRNAAAAICSVTINPGEKKGDIGIFYYPSLQAVVSGSSGTLWTFNTAGEKSAAVREDVAKRRGWSSLAAMVKKTFKTEFEKTLYNR